MLNSDELDAAIKACLAEGITKEYIESRIKDKTFLKIGETVTVCNLILDNGYSVRGESACVNDENYSISYENAFSKLWPLFNFCLAEFSMVKEPK